MSKNNQEYEWLQFVEFGDKAIKFNDEEGSIVDKMDIFRVPGGKDKVPTIKHLGDLSADFAFFALAPVYVTCNIPFDIFGEFKAMRELDGRRYDGPRLVLRFKKPVLSGFHAWDYMLEAMPKGEDFDDFMRYCTTQCIRQRESDSYWTIKRNDMLIYDPLDIDNNTRTEDTKIIVSTMLPSGNRFQLVPGPIGLPPYTFKRVSPDVKVIAEATAMLKL